ncbi:MAG TPA: hypothetical protein VK675_01010 [Candidatus Paceibacterota bacterium]|nr:hypothetical protein [Candidatus Paceibacterota bacterium]
MKTNEEESILLVPEDQEVFELTIESNTIYPTEMLRADGGDNPNKLKFKGPSISGEQTKKFKLFRVHNQLNADEANKSLAVYGAPALGQWREAFKKKYPRPDGKGPIAFTGSEWLDPYRRRAYPFLLDGSTAWYSGFRWFDHGINISWRIAFEIK